MGLIVLVNEDLVGRCGLYCGACFVYRAYKDSKELQRTIAERMRPPRKPEDIRCEGCQTVLTSSNAWMGEDDFPLIGGRRCKIVACLENKALGFCYECDEYPDCQKFRFMYEDSLKWGEDLMKNFGKLKAGKVREWLEEENNKWRCRKCGKPTAMYVKDCHWCGAKLRV